MAELIDDAMDFEEHIFVGKEVNVSKLADELLAATGLKFKADNDDDTVHGSITQTAAGVFIHVYTVTKPPLGYRKSTLQRPATMPTKEQINAVILNHKKEVLE